MLVVVIVIAILGTNLLLGFFVANTLGYGPQTVNELLTGIYKVPVGWTLRKLVSGDLSPDTRAQWAQQMGEYCCTAPTAEPESTLEPESNDVSDEPSDDEDEDSDDDQSFPSPGGDTNPSDNAPADYRLLRSVMQFVQTSPVLLDELRFQWQYLPKADSSKFAESSQNSQATKGKANDELPGDEDTREDAEGMDREEDGAEETEDNTATTNVAASKDVQHWTKERLVGALTHWTEYLEAYEPAEVDWWLDWFQHWERFSNAWRKHCTEVLAVGLVERLLHENQPEPVISEDAPKSVKSAKLAPPVETKKPKSGNPRQEWIKSQYGRLVQSLFASSSQLRKAQLDLLEFTSSKAVTQWEPQLRSGGSPKAPLKTIFPLSPLLELNFDETFQPNLLMVIIPDHRRLLNLDAGQLVSAAVDSGMIRTIHQWNEEQLLPGQWFITDQNWTVGFMNTDDATAQQKASWIAKNLSQAKFVSNQYSLEQTCSVVIAPIDEGKSPSVEIAATLELLQRKAISRRISVGDSLWRIKAKSLNAIAKDEVEVDPIEIILGFDGIAPSDQLPALTDDIADEDDGNEDW